ncbi:vertnin isoform X3 [Nerophis ophidion]|uniref:vertnin isoform X3 n=1 Tax=Nerophis ophidion TaxID=159077 RepID=UPI002AE0B222|nr:vertnin isoform X3 [Nerophis ophidion]
MLQLVVLDVLLLPLIITGPNADAQGFDIAFPCYDLVCYNVWSFRIRKSRETIVIISNGVIKEATQSKEDTECTVYVQHLREDDDKHYCKQAVDDFTAQKDAPAVNLVPGKMASFQCVLLSFLKNGLCNLRQKEVRLAWVDQAGVELQDDSRHGIRYKSSCHVTLTVTLQGPGRETFNCRVKVGDGFWISEELRVQLTDVSEMSISCPSNNVDDDVVYADVILPACTERVSFCEDDATEWSKDAARREETTFVLLSFDREFSQNFAVMIQRKEVVLSVLKDLQEATENAGLEVLTRKALEVDQVLAPFQLPRMPCQDFPEWVRVDNIAQGLYPGDAPVDLLPLHCKGRGNLLFDAASMLLMGNSALGLELQVRTVVEMVLWKRYYLSGMIDSKMMLQAVRFSLCAEESEEMLNLPATVLEAIFDADIKASCFQGSYANMWHVYALSSVLQFSIYSIYPMFNLKIRPYFNRLIRPRKWPQDSKTQTLHIMWSGELNSESLFRPNHFVALVRASDFTVKCPDSEPRLSPMKSDEPPNNQPQFSYPSLKDKYNITKRTFYRWKRQSQEHCKKSAARYEAKYFLQACYMEGKLLPLHQFKAFFPEISRSSYYNWKHELLKSGGNFSTSSSTGEVSPGESTEQEVWSSPETRQDESDHHDNVASMFGLNMAVLDLDRVQNVVHMQEAKRCLQNCIAMNTSLPFRIFKRNFPGISRSTYYNWRREAMLFSRGYKASACSSEDSSDVDKCHSPKSLSPTPHNIARDFVPRTTIFRPKHRSFHLAYVGKKQLRDGAKLLVQKSKLSLSKFKLRFPTLSLCFFWLWKNSRRKSKAVNQRPEAPKVEQRPLTVATEIMMADNHRVFPFMVPPTYVARPNIAAFNAPQPQRSHVGAPPDERMLDVVTLANFKAKAKLFLQQRFEEKSFPSFKEFRSYFPFTPRSTYYMWKRALHHGVSLVHG